MSQVEKKKGNWLIVSYTNYMSHRRHIIKTEVGQMNHKISDEEFEALMELMIQYWWYQVPSLSEVVVDKGLWTTLRELSDKDLPGRPATGDTDADTLRNFYEWAPKAKRRFLENGLKVHADKIDALIEALPEFLEYVK